MHRKSLAPVEQSMTYEQELQVIHPFADAPSGLVDVSDAGPKTAFAIGTASLFYKEGAYPAAWGIGYGWNFLDAICGFIEMFFTLKEAEKKKRADKEHWMKIYAGLLGFSSTTLTAGTLGTMLANIGAVKGVLATAFAPLGGITFAVAMWVSFSNSLYHLCRAAEKLNPIKSLTSHIKTCEDIQNKIKKINETISSLSPTEESTVEKKEALCELKRHLERGYIRVKQQTICQLKVEYAKESTPPVHTDSPETQVNKGHHEPAIDEQSPVMSENTPPPPTPKLTVLSELSKQLIELQANETSFSLTDHSENNLSEVSARYETDADGNPPPPTGLEERLNHYRQKKQAAKFEEKTLDTVAWGYAAVGMTLIAASAAFLPLLPFGIAISAIAAIIKTDQLIARFSSNKKRKTSFKEIEGLIPNTPEVDEKLGALNEFLETNDQNKNYAPEKKIRLWLAYQLYLADNPGPLAALKEEAFYATLFKQYKDEKRTRFLGLWKRESELDEYLGKSTQRMMETIMLRQVLISMSNEEAVTINENNIMSLIIPHESDNEELANGEVDAIIQGLSNNDREKITRTLCEKRHELANNPPAPSPAA